MTTSDIERAHPSALRSAETWIFDLDNTLYPARCNLFDQVDRRMSAFISRTLDIPQVEARAIQKKYFREYGTTLSGLMDRHGVNPAEFLGFVHDIDYSPITGDPRLAGALDRIAARKVILTNGTVAHAEAVVERLGIARHFDAIFDIEAAGYVPKPRPEPYHALLAREGIAPERAVMVEDIAQNLEIPAQLGMRTVWVRTDHAWSHPGVADEGAAPAAYVHHVTEDLGDFLELLLAAP
ncbi:pyrimidine 5'-nucleotidase [Marivibrio halodurans]|uniref:Pyrimidine 5'-nucleotidase n=1 Tax=Marivibrio halodurans TaxID=2039722 RepID=A0A8J7S3M8_9PROT|nr:pyrimidine 5'-nucleotidase [Marivibrio halodurans]MBP5858104.1 pyrimidine 5'-nucleotidase [Marivibrio halodurans]